MGKPLKDDDKSNGIGFKLGKAVATMVSAEKKVATCSVVLPQVLKEESILTDISSSLYAALYSDNR